MVRFSVVVMIIIATVLMAVFAPSPDQATGDDSVPAIKTSKSEDATLISRTSTALGSAKVDMSGTEGATPTLTGTRQQPTYDARTRARCNDACQNLLELFRQNREFTDDELAQAMGHLETLVTMLKNSPRLQQDLIAVATQGSGNVREVILAAFYQLEPAAQRSLGNALIDAGDSPQRLDGVQLLARANVMNESVATSLEQLYATEQDEYVRAAAVRALNQQKLFHNDASTIEFLTYVMQTETETTVRGEALLASVQLSDDAEFAMVHSLEALRSQSVHYPEFGARALTAFLTRYTLDGNEIDWQYTQEMEYLMSEIMGPEYDHLPADTRAQIDSLYDRFF